MTSIQQRLEQSVAILGALERKRDEMRSPALGRDTEWLLIERELRDLEQDILRNPGALHKTAS
ncbi:MAG: hypothetical protein IT165_14615 [Bryobacterales bacterium]|nr:hypothetical protein [Bryobacterales bacterium]